MIKSLCSQLFRFNILSLVNLRVKFLNSQFKVRMTCYRLLKKVISFTP